MSLTERVYLVSGCVMEKDRIVSSCITERNRLVSAWLCHIKEGLVCDCVAEKDMQASLRLCRRERQAIKSPVVSRRDTVGDQPVTLCDTAGN